MVFKSNRQRRFVMAKIKVLGRQVKINIVEQNNRFVVRDSQRKIIAVGKTKSGAIKRAKFILKP